MKCTPKKLKKILKNSIQEISAHPELFVQNPTKDFIRERKLPFEQVLKVILAMTGKSLRGELMDYFNLNTAMPTVSAFVQQRNKIDHHAFEALFHTFTNTVDEACLFKGYKLFAVDGSDLHTPTNREEKESFYEGANGQKSYNLFHLNALYDLQRRIYVDAIVQKSRCANEHKAFVEMIDRNNSNIPIIYIADRGYESYNNMAHIIEKGQKFVIRARDINKRGLIFGMNLSQEDEFDVSVRFGLTRQRTKQVKDSDLKFISHTSLFDYLPQTSRKSVMMQPYYLSFRIVRFKLTEDTYEVLLTNLNENEFSLSELKKLYAMRWGIETSFRDLKYSLALSYFHSRKTENILQEVFAKLIMYNFAELITSHVVVKQKNRKHSYRINFSAAVHICRKFFLKNISPQDVEALLLMHLLPVRKESANPRGRSAKNAPSFMYRIP